MGHLRFVKFALIGLSNTALAFVVFNLLAVRLGLPGFWSNAAAWLVGFANSFIWNRKWTFADRTGLRGGPLLARFAVANLAALAASSGVILGVQALQGPGRHGFVGLNGAEAIAILAALVVNYALSSRWVFRETKSSRASS